MKEFLMVGAGGFLGSVLRYFFSLFDLNTGKLPISTISVNLIGSLVIGLLSAYYLGKRGSSLEILLITGFCGGFTTFSTFSLQLMRLFESGDTMLAIVYICVSLLGGVGLCFLGFSLGIKIFP